MLETDPIDLLLDEDTHDLVFENGDFVWSRGLQGVAQDLKIAWKMIRGEVFTNVNEGVRYFENDHVSAADAIIGAKFDLAKATNEFRDVALQNSLITEIVELEVTFDDTTRTLTVSGTMRTEWGDFTATLTREA